MRPGSVPDSLAVVYRSTDGGSSWQPFSKGIPEDATVSAFVVAEDQELFAAADHHGIYSVREGGVVWSRVDTDLPDGIDINALSLANNSLIIGTHSHGIMISSNGGRNWNYSKDRIASPVRCLDQMKGVLVAGGDDGIYRSTDNGNSWDHVMSEAQVNGFTTAGDGLYAALSKGAVKSTDEGKTWVYVYASHTLHDISSDGTNVYAMTLGDGLLMSRDQGNSWHRVNDGMGTFNFYTFEVKAFGQRTFAAQWHGIYEWDETKSSWSKITIGLPDSTAFTTLESTGRGLIAGIGLR